MKKISLVAFMFLFIFCSVSAQFSKVGSSGAQFLKIGVGSKYQGAGEATAAFVNDAYAMYWNPAGLVGVTEQQAVFTKVNYLLDVNLNYFAYAKNYEEIGVFGFSATVLSMDDLEITNFENQNGTGEFYSASSYSLGLSFARQLNAKVAFGATFKYVGEKIHHLRSSGIAFDFGTMLNTGFNSLRMGMSITNMGPKMSFSGSDLVFQNTDSSGVSVTSEKKASSYELPLVFRIGFAYDIDFSSQSVLTLLSEFKHPNDNLEQGSLGTQFAFDDKYFLRGGYKINYDEEGLAFGGGIKTKIGEESQLFIDYAWQDFGRLASTQRFSIGFAF